MLGIKLECGFGWATDHGIKPERVGVKVWLGNYRFELRRRAEHEVPKEYWEGESRHGWQVERDGLYETSYLPLGRWCVDGFHNLKTYAEAVGVDNLHLDWILDEFDSSFNELAAGSLKYHMDYAVTYCSPEQRAEYQDLVDRLLEPHPSFTDEEMSILYPPEREGESMFVEGDDGTLTLRSPGPEEKQVYQAHRSRENAWNERINKARHDFVEIMPGLWS